MQWTMRSVQWVFFLFPLLTGKAVADSMVTELQMMRTKL